MHPDHPHAPRFTHPGIDRLTPRGLRRAREFAAQLHDEPPRWRPGALPDWVWPFVEQAYGDVPFYRRLAPAPRPFTDLPTCSRADLSRAPWEFVPDSQSLADLTVYHTSGATGHPLAILTHADTLALYLPLLDHMLAAHHVALARGAGHTALVLVCAQKSTYTYLTPTAVLDGAMFVKINLNPTEWPDPADRARFLDDCAPTVFTGDPVAFRALLDLPLTQPPLALVSTAMTLLPGLQRQLEQRFGCPVLDVYSLNETGPVAVRMALGRWGGAAQGSEGARGPRSLLQSPGSNPQSPMTDYQLLQPHLYVEILDPADQPCPPGERGEITVTGGINPFLPLVRYRTGDYAALVYAGDAPYLVGLEGRAPVVFVRADGQLINNIDVTMALRPLALPQFQLYQAADGALVLTLPRSASAEAASAQTRLRDLFGAAQPLAIVITEALGNVAEKVIQYRREIDT
jgi:phenylacetate-CoA ligase